MPTYICCSQPHCYQKSLQAQVPDEELADLWYCDKHKTREDRDCQYTGCSLPGIFTDKKLKGVGYCMHHRRYVMDGMKESEVTRLKKAFDLVGKWLSAAQEDPAVCDEMKADIAKAFELRGEI